MADNQQTTVEVLVNGKQAEAELDKVRKQVDDLRSAWISAAQAGDKAVAESLRKELKKSERELKTMESGVHAVERTFRQLDKATPTDLQRSLKFLQSGLKNIERGSSAWTEQVNKIRLLKAELDKVNTEMRASESVLTRIKNGINNWGASIVAGAAGISGLVAAGRSAVKAYADMQQEEANVRKYTGMTEEQVARLNEEFKRMDTRTSREALNMLAQEAGRLGKQSEEDVLGFVRAADKINVALDDLGDGATLTLSKLTTIFGDEQRLGTEKALLSVGSVINEELHGIRPLPRRVRTEAGRSRSASGHVHTRDYGLRRRARRTGTERGNVSHRALQGHHEPVQKPREDCQSHRAIHSGVQRYLQAFCQ